MLILDSNIWIHASTIGSDRSRSYVDEILFESEECAVSPYIFEEVITNINRDRTIQRVDRDRALEEFSATVFQCDSIENPTQDEVRAVDLDDTRKEAYYRLIGALGDIQPKDAPILTLAYEYIDDAPTIVTADEPFGECTPAEYGIPEISIEHVPLVWDGTEQTIEYNGIE